MFSYQCRYCKVNFDQWEKLVTHRRDEHRQEFEALKRRFVQLHGRREEDITRTRRLLCTVNNREHLKGVLVKSFSSTTPKRFNRMRPMSTSSSGFVTPPRCNMEQASAKELDANDLEDQEISLRIPNLSGAVNHYGSIPEAPSSSTSFNGDWIPPYSFPTPTSSPRLNGSGMSNGYNGHDNEPSTSSYSYITPPVTPSRLSIHSESPLLSEEEIELNMNWSPPVDLATAVQYHQMSDDAEIEIFAIPTDSPCITVTRHYPANGRFIIPAILEGLPVFTNVNGGWNRTRNRNGAAGTPTNPLNRENHPDSRSSPQQHVTSSHVVIEDLDGEELRMICSLDSTTDNDNLPNGEGEETGDTATVPAVSPGLPQQASEGEGVNCTGKRLKPRRRRSQLQKGQKRKKSAFSSRRLAESIAVVNAFGDEVVTKRIRSNDDSTISCSGFEDTSHSGRSRRSGSNNNTSTKNVPNPLRLNKRASPRRPK